MECWTRQRRANSGHCLPRRVSRYTTRRFAAHTHPPAPLTGCDRTDTGHGVWQDYTKIPHGTKITALTQSGKMTGVGASSPSSSPSSSSLFSLSYLLLLRSNLPVQFTPTSRIHPFHPSVLSQPMGREYAMACTVVGRTCLLTAWICVIIGCCRLVCGDCGVCVWTPSRMQIRQPGLEMTTKCVSTRTRKTGTVR